MEEAPALVDVSDGETDFLRPGEDDGDPFREEGQEDLQYDPLEQGELEGGGGGLMHPPIYMHAHTCAHIHTHTH